jgi:hypothetical protein
MLEQFQKNQVQPEYIYYLAESYYSDAISESRQTAILLIDQFLLNLNDSYRQSKLVRLLLLQFHYKVVVKQMWHKGVEIANYLL